MNTEFNDINGFSLYHYNGGTNQNLGEEDEKKFNPNIIKSFSTETKSKINENCVGLSYTLHQLHKIIFKFYVKINLCFQCFKHFNDCFNSCTIGTTFKL